MLRKPPAISLDVGSLEQAEQAGAVNVRITNKDSGITYGTTIEHIRLHGFRLDRGYGAQIALVIDSWTQTRHGIY